MPEDRDGEGPWESMGVTLAETPSRAYMEPEAAPPVAQGSQWRDKDTNTYTQCPTQNLSTSTAGTKME